MEASGFHDQRWGWMRAGVGVAKVMTHLMLPTSPRSLSAGAQEPCLQAVSLGTGAGG